MEGTEKPAKCIKITVVGNIIDPDKFKRELIPNVKKQEQLFDMGPEKVCKVSGRKGFVTPGQALGAFNADFLDAAKCRRFILEKIHAEGPACPNCRAMIDDLSRLQRFWFAQRISCRHCGRFFSATSQTFLAGRQLGFRQIFVALMLLAIKKKNKEIANAVGCNPDTIRLLRRRIDILTEVDG